MFKVAAGAVFIGSAYQLLRRGSTYDQFITAVNTCVLPAGVKLIQIAEGSVILKVQAEDISALDTLWGSYSDGTLGESLQKRHICHICVWETSGSHCDYRPTRIRECEKRVNR